MKKMGFFPQYLRTDCGAENGIIAGIQCLFLVSEDAHRYGSSISNQRIENWWSHIRKGFTDWLIEFFKDLVNENISLGIRHISNVVGLSFLLYYKLSWMNLAAIGIPILSVNHDMILLLVSQMCCFIYQKKVVISIKNMILLTQKLKTYCGSEMSWLKENLKLIDAMLNWKNFSVTLFKMKVYLTLHEAGEKQKEILKKSWYCALKHLIVLTWTLVTGKYLSYEKIASIKMYSVKKLYLKVVF